MNRPAERLPSGHHKTPRDVAEYMLTGPGNKVGRHHETHGDVWNNTEYQRIGLLELILLELRKNRVSADHWGRPESWFYLQCYHQEFAEAQQTHARHLKRIAKFCDIDALQSRDLVMIWGRDSTDDPSFRLRRLQQRNNHLKKCKNIDSLITLHGIGPATVKRLKAAKANE